MSDHHLRLISDTLRAYASRGVLREFTERPERAGVAFSFLWLLDRRFTLIADPAKSRLVLKDLLPRVPARSPLDRAVREFAAGRAAAKLPAHRRIDPGRAVLSCVNRHSNVSLVLSVKRNQYKYAVPKLLNVCQELFSHVEKVDVQYAWEQLGLPEE